MLKLFTDNTFLTSSVQSQWLSWPQLSTLAILMTKSSFFGFTHYTHFLSEYYSHHHFIKKAHTGWIYLTSECQPGQVHSAVGYDPAN